MRAKTTSRFKGVSWITKDAVWQAKVSRSGVCRYIGSFGSENAAALAYDRAAFTYHGEFANYNFPDNKQYTQGWLHWKDKL